MLISIDNDLSYPMQLINNITSFIVYLINNQYLYIYIAINAYISVIAYMCLLYACMIIPPNINI